MEALLDNVLGDGDSRRASTSGQHFLLELNADEGP